MGKNTKFIIAAAFGFIALLIIILVLRQPQTVPIFTVTPTTKTTSTVPQTYATPTAPQTSNATPQTTAPQTTTPQTTAPQIIPPQTPVPQKLTTAPVAAVSIPVTAAAVANKTCYGASDGTCVKCGDVLNAYNAKGWAFDPSKIAQCTATPTRPNRTCYGASDGVCNTCADVINAYKTRGWAFDTASFDQCQP